MHGLSCPWSVYSYNFTLLAFSVNRGVIYQGGQQTTGNGPEVARQGVLSCEARHPKGIELAILGALSLDGEKFFQSLHWFRLNKKLSAQWGRTACLALVVAEV